jgi:hypothetical protein
MATERRTCRFCGKDVPVRRNGDLREHYVYKPQAEQDTTRPLGRVRVCEGAGTMP